MRRLALGGSVALFGAFALLLATSVAVAAGSSHRGSPAPRHKFGRGTSTNWSGYAVPGTGATHVIGTWTAPAASCASGENSWSSPWVGIDGYASNTVEQIGTDSDCWNGTPVYYAWYEMYPKKLFGISSINVHPGDSVTGEVTNTSPGTFLLNLTDNTTGASFQTTQRSKRAQHSSVEWIMEGPSNGLLTDFGSVDFSAARATISNQTGNLGSFANADPITMVTQQGVPRAVPSAVRGGTRFSVTWQHG